MKKFGICSIAVVMAACTLAFTNVNPGEISDCTSGLYWFRVQDYYYGNCAEARYFLEYPSDCGDGFPDEVFYGNKNLAINEFGCWNGYLYCCAIGYNYSDIELNIFGQWRPKQSGIPQCVINKNQ